jgi:hypothetical protein
VGADEKFENWIHDLVSASTTRDHASRRGILRRDCIIASIHQCSARCGEVMLEEFSSHHHLAVTLVHASVERATPFFS